MYATNMIDKLIFADDNVFILVKNHIYQGFKIDTADNIYPVSQFVLLHAIECRRLSRTP